MNLDQVIVSKRSELERETIVRLRQLLEESETENIIWNGFISGICLLSDEHLFDLYYLCGRIWQGHKGYSGQTIEEPLKNELMKNDIECIPQVKISEDGRYCPCLPTKKVKLERLCFYHDIDFTGLTCPKMKDKLKQKFPMIKVAQGDFLIIPKGMAKPMWGDKLDGYFHISCKTEVRERWKGEQYPQVDWGKKIHVGLESKDKLITKMTDWEIYTIDPNGSNDRSAQQLIDDLKQWCL